MCDFTDISNSDIKHTIDEYIHSDRDRIILVKNLIDNWTYQQISDYLYKLDEDNLKQGIRSKYFLSPKQIGRLILKQEKIVFKHLNK